MKHKLKIKDLFLKKELFGIILFIIFSFLLSIYFLFVSFYSFLFMFLLIVFVPIFFFIKKAKNKIVRVIRITENNEVARFNFEYWEKNTIKNLDRKFFWKYKNKLIVVCHDGTNGLNPIYPFNKPLPAVTSGHIKRTQVQNSTDDLMIAEKTSLKEAVVLGGIFLLCGGLGVLNYAMFNNMLEKL